MNPTQAQAGSQEPVDRWWQKPFVVGVRHYLEMVIAMVAGMLLLGPVVEIIGSALGIGAILARPDVAAVVMATTMTIAMTGWMRIRKHRWVPIAEMAAAMYAPFLLLLVPFWAGLIDAAALHTGGHLLMLPAMALVMLLRRHEYTSHRHAGKRGG